MTRVVPRPKGTSLSRGRHYIQQGASVCVSVTIARARHAGKRLEWTH